MCPRLWGHHKKIGCAAPVMALESGAAPSAPTWHPAPRAAAADCGGTAGTPRRLIPEGGADPVTKRQRRALDHERHGAPRPAHAASPRWREVQTAKHRAGGRRSGAETHGESLWIGKIKVFWRRHPGRAPPSAPRWRPPRAHGAGGAPSAPRQSRGSGP